MADIETALLQEVQAPWEFASHLDHGGVDPTTTVADLLASRPDKVISALQNQGVSKLGEMELSSDVVYPAFKKEAFLTLGSHQRAVDYQRMWEGHLNELARHAPKPEGWTSNVIVEAFVVNVKGAAMPDQDGLVQPLLKRWQTGTVGLDIFGVPALQAVIDFKWDAFARRLLLWELVFFTIWLLSFFGFTILFQDEVETMSLSELLHTHRGRITVGLELLAVVAMLPFLVLEYGTISAYGVGWFNVWNMLDTATYTLQITITVLHLTRDVHGAPMSIACSLQCIMLLFRLQYFSRVFTATRFSFLEAVKEAISAISVYIIFMLLIMFGFAVAFHVLFREDQQHAEFRTITEAFLTMYALQGGLLSFSLMRDSHTPTFAVLLAVSYYFVMGLILLNMLIGIMGGALAKTEEGMGLKMVLHKAEIIDELESTMPRWLENKFKDIWYPEFVHILRIDTDRLDKPDLGCMWSPTNNQDTGKAVGGSEAKLEAMQQQLNRMEAMLQAMGGSGGGLVGVSVQTE